MTDSAGGSYLEHARNSYAEVLDATKHQDDKIFLDIGRRDIDDWRALWGPVPGGTGALDRSITSDYVEESYNIARRAVRKYERSRDASGLFVAAMPFFALTITLAVYSLAGRPVPAVGAVDVVDWTLAVRLIVGAVLGAFTLVLVFADASRGAVGIDPIAVLTYPLFVAALPGAAVRDGATEAVLFGLVAVSGFLTARVLARRFAGVGDQAPGVRGRLAQTLIFAASVLSIVVAALGWPLWQLALAVAAMTVLPLTNPLQALLRLIPSDPAHRG